MLGDLPGAIRDFTRAIELDPDQATAYRNRSRLWLKLGEFEEARLDLEVLDKLQPPDKSLQLGLKDKANDSYSLGMALFYKGNYQASFSALTEVVLPLLVFHS